MAIEMLVGLNVIDAQAYQLYRDKMTPMLTRIGGGFGYDFSVFDVLKSMTDAPINRLFTIHFPSEAAMHAFFSNDAYLNIKQNHFEGAVSDTTVIATYHR